MAKIHEIDPNADTVIILKNPLVDFADWNCSEEGLDARDSVSLVDCPAEERSTNGSAVEPSEPDESSQEVARYHVSSSVLKLVSPHFERMLSGGDWKEGTPSGDDGRYHIVVEDWDEEALLVLMNAFHLRTRLVPRSLPLDMLAKIAQLVDFYDCLEAVELWAGNWIKDLKNLTPIPSKPDRDLMLWMYIAWIFGLSEEFTRTTTIAIKQSPHSELSVSELPVTRFIDRIDQVRNEAISTIIARLYDLLEKYRDSNYHCPTGSYSLECGSILYGALTKGMDSLKLLSPYPQAPFPGVSIVDICTNICNIQSPKWRGMSGYSSFNGYSDYHSVHSCDLTKELIAIANGVQNTITGFKLTDFGRI